MDKILEMREKRAELWEKTKRFLDEHTDKDGTLSAQDEETYEKMEKDVVNLGKDIERLERQAVIEADMNSPINRPLVGSPGNSDREKSVRGTAKYREAILNAMRTGFRKIDNVLQEGVDTSGGYLVPEEYDKRLVDVLEEENVMRRFATVILTSGEHKINIAGSKPAASWIEEGKPLTFGDATFEQVMLDAHKLHVAIKVTEELLYDSAFNLESYIITQFGRALANAEEDAFINGDGVSKPEGILKKAETGITATVEGVTADTIMDLIYSLKRPYRKRAKFLLHDSSLSFIRKLKDANGSYLWQPSYQAGEPDKLLGYEVITSSYMPKIAASKSPILFGDMSYYNIGDRGVRSIQELKELFAGNGMVGYVMKERVDGKLVLPEAVKLLKTTKA